MIGEDFKVVTWTNSDTAVFWAYSSETNLGALFEVKVDAVENWKPVKTKVLFGKAAEKEQGW